MALDYWQRNLTIIVPRRGSDSAPHITGTLQKSPPVMQDPSVDALTETTEARPEHDEFWGDSDAETLPFPGTQPNDDDDVTPPLGPAVVAGTLGHMLAGLPAGGDASSPPQ